jgi:hypothetical protein
MFRYFQPDFYKQFLGKTAKIPSVVREHQQPKTARKPRKDKTEKKEPSDKQGGGGGGRSRRRMHMHKHRHTRKKGIFGFLNKVFPKNKVVSSVASGFTNVMKNLGKQLGEITGVKATAQMAKNAPGTLLKRAGAGALIGVGLAEFFIEEQMKKGDSGPEVKKLQEFINFMSSQPEAKGFGITPIKVDGRYGDETVKQVSKFKKWIMSTGQYDVKNTDGTYVQPEIAQAMGVELQPSGFNKVVDWAFGKGAMNTFGTKLAQADQWTKKTFGDPTKNNKSVVSAA